MLNFTINNDACIGCGECVKDCFPAILTMKENRPAVIESKANACIQCQHCMAVCPTGALSILGYAPENALPVKDAYPSAKQMEMLIKGRRSYRRFKQEPVDTETIDALLAITAYAPTGVNNRSVLLTVVEDPKTMQELREATYEGIRTGLANNMAGDRTAFFQAVLSAWDSEKKDIVYRNAPHLLVTSAPKSAPTPEPDGFIALSYFDLMAQSMNIGTLWDGIANIALQRVAPDVCQRLGLPEDHIPVYMMAFGKPAVRYFRTVQREAQHVNKVVW